MTLWERGTPVSVDLDFFNCQDLLHKQGRIKRAKRKEKNTNV